jgi:hypothetical protein
VAPRIVGFVTPDTDLGFTANIPVPRLGGSRTVRLGEPIFLGRPRYTAARAFRPDPSGIERASRAAAQEGAGFFRGGWERRLRALVGTDGVYETSQEADEAIRSDVAGALSRIRERCPNPAASHLCYPWYARNERADRIAREAGIEVAYGGVTIDRKRTRLVLRRLPPDFLWRLPGPGRISLTELIRRRVRALRSATRPY